MIKLLLNVATVLLVVGPVGVAIVLAIAIALRVTGTPVGYNVANGG